MKRVIVFIFLFIGAQLTTAQIISLDKTIVISGKVIDAQTSQPLEYATISLLRTGQDKVIGTTTDKNGSFRMDVDAGVYVIKVDFLSFKPYRLKSKLLTNDTDLGIISLISDNVLDEVAIDASKNLVEYEINKKIYNASADIANAGGTALNVLKNTPSVRVNAEGIISIRGANPTILIDGKPQFNLDNSFDFLKSFPSNSIDKVEIITRSAKYSSSGGAILNIITKKNKNQAYSGSFEAHTGIPDNHGGSIFFNKKTDHVNLFSTVSFTNSQREKTIDIEQPLLNLFEESTQDRQRNNFLLNLGSDFYLNSKNTLTASFLINNSKKDNHFSIVSREFDRNTDENDKYTKLELQLGYTLELNDKGQKIKLSLNYENTNSDNQSDIIESDKPFSTDILQEFTKDQQLNNFLAQLDYTLPLSKNKNIELGYKGTFRSFTNAYQVVEFDNVLNTNAILENFDDVYSYDENIHGFYAQYNATQDKLSYSLGLRTEISDVASNEQNNGIMVNKTFTDFFPSASIAYEISDNSHISANYNRSIERPLVPQLNPFISFAYQRFQTIGNPNLNPFYGDYFELLFDTQIKGVTIASALFLNNQQDQALSILENTGLQTNNGDEIFTRKFINSGNKNIVGLDLDVTVKPFKGLRLNGYVSPYQFEIKNAIDDAYNFKNTVWYAEGSALISLNNGFKFSVSHKYQSPIVNGLSELRTINFTNLTLSKNLFKNNATITFRAVDVFKTKRFNYVSTEASTLTRHNVFFENQYSLTFSYFFNQKRKSSKDRSKDLNKDDLEDKQDKKL